MRQRKNEDIDKLENAKDRLLKEIEQRERQIVDDKLQNERLVRLKNEYQEE